MCRREERTILHLRFSFSRTDSSTFFVSCVSLFEIMAEGRALGTSINNNNNNNMNYSLQDYSTSIEYFDKVYCSIIGFTC